MALVTLGKIRKWSFPLTLFASTMAMATPVTLSKDTFIGGQFYVAGSVVDSSLLASSTDGYSPSLGKIGAINGANVSDALTAATSAAPAASTPTGSELFPCVQGGATSRCTPNAIFSSLGVSYTHGGYPKLSAAINNVRNRVGPAIIAAVGDSSVAGWGSGVTTGTGAGSTPAVGTTFSKAKSWPMQMVSAFQAAGIPARGDAFFGVGAGPSNADTVLINPDLVLGADWSVYNLTSFGGWSLSESATGTTSQQLKPEVAADCLDVTYARLSSFGQFSITDPARSATLATADASLGTGPGDTQTVTACRTVASREPFSIQRTGGGAIYIVGERPYARDNPMLEVWNMGWGGSKASDWAASGGNGWQPYTAIAALPTQPNLWINELGFNDSKGGATASAFQTALATVVAREKLGGGDVQLVNPHVAIDPSSPSYVISTVYLASIAAVQAANGLPATIDFNGGVSLVTTDRYDGVHLTSAGYAKEAVSAGSAILSIK